MAAKTTLLFLAVASFVSYSTSTRILPDIQPGFNLTARLEEAGGLADCWNALMEIRSCSNEIIVFFLVGHADISPPCCHAISVITHNCWPSMLSSIGFTAEEGSVLSGYCDSSNAASPAPADAPVQSLSIAA